MKTVLAIDIGGTKIAVGLVYLNGHILAKTVEPTKVQLGPHGVIKQVTEMAQRVMAEMSKRKLGLLATGIGVAGPLDINKGIILAAPNLPGWKNIQLTNPIQKAFKTSVYFNNDANAAALGEWMFGAGKGTKNMVYFTVSTGIGGGIIINKQIYSGRNNAGELGHMIINPNGPKCNCGLYGCLEAHSSGTAIVREAKKAPKKSLIWKIAKKKDRLDAGIVFEAMDQGDRRAQRIIDEALTALSIGVLNTVHAFDPDKIVLGGGVMKSSKYIIPFVRSYVQAHAMAGFGKTRIVSAKLKQNVGLLGAACLAIQALKKPRKKIFKVF